MADAARDATFTFADPDGFVIFVRKWLPTPGIVSKAVVQIAHGAAEHSGRYERFARYLNAAGYGVYANDHRGHGQTAGSKEQAGKAGPDGWNGIVRDAKLLTDIVRQENPHLPMFLFGHSLGSLLVQQYIQAWGAGLRGAVLCGTFGALPNLDDLIAMAEKESGDRPSPTFGAIFAAFNQPFGHGRTGFEWLSRDEAERQRYVDDPWFGFPFTSALVADCLKGARETWKPENEARVPKDLPILLVSGSQDPAGGNTQTVRLLMERYQALQLKDVTRRFYAGARHDILNETNRDEVQGDILQWLDRHAN